MEIQRESKPLVMKQDQLDLVVINGTIYSSIEFDHERLIARNLTQETKIRFSHVAAYEYSFEERKRNRGLLVAGILLLILGLIFILFFGLLFLITGVAIIIFYLVSRGPEGAELVIYTDGGEFRVQSSRELIVRLRNLIV